MNIDLEEKIDLIKKVNTDDSNFIIKVYENYQKHKQALENKIKISSIILKDEFDKSTSNIVDLDLIWCKPYFYTKMRIHLDIIIEKLVNTNKLQILKNPSRFCKALALNNTIKTFEKSENEIDIVDFIKILHQKKMENPDYNSDFIFIAKKIDEETLFKEEQIAKAIKIIDLDTPEKKYEKVYFEVYSYLKDNFVANNYCDFKNNKCAAQRHFNLYPLNRKNGCCFTRIRTCPHLQKNGECNVECMACRLFSCPYLSKRGITYYASEFVLLKAFLTKKQRKHLVFDFYTTKSNVLKKVSKKI